MTTDQRNKIEQIIKRLTELIENRDVNLLNGGCTGLDDSKKVRYLNDDLIELRLCGAPCYLPQTYTTSDSNSYFEAAAEIARQATEYLHPVRTWLTAHWVELISCSISIIALIVSIT